jgi:hypothetical protein
MRWKIVLSLVVGAVSAGAQAPSSLVKPAAADVQQTMAHIHVERWKLSRALRETTTGNIDSIVRDVSVTLNPMLDAADAKPDSVPALLPVSRNLAALYEVMLRVTVTSEAGAPRADVDALAQAMNALQQARRAFDDLVQKAAAAEDAQVIALKKQLAATAVTATPPTPPACPPPKPTPKRKKKAPAAGAAT